MRRFAQTLLFFSIALVGFMQAPAQGEIKFRDSQKTYEAIGRVINAETGAGIAFYEIRCGKLNKTRLDDYPITDYQTDAQGRFRMTGLTSGTYQVSGLSSYGNKQFHAEMTTFDIADSNVEGVELKVYRLASVSGTVIFQGVVDEQSRERLISSGLAFEVKQTSKRGYPKWSSVTPASDGRFQITGLPPGKLIFYAAELNLVWKPEHYPWQILKVERNGVDVSNGIEIDYGQEIGGFYVVFVEGKGVIEGQVHVAGPALPEDTAISVIAKQDDPVRSLYASLRVSSAGRA